MITEIFEGIKGAITFLMNIGINPIAILCVFFLTKACKDELTAFSGEKKGIYTLILAGILSVVSTVITMLIFYQPEKSILSVIGICLLNIMVNFTVSVAGWEVVKAILKAKGINI